jgi:hypothetical protein
MSASYLLRRVRLTTVHQMLLVMMHRVARHATGDKVEAVSGPMIRLLRSVSGASSIVNAEHAPRCDAVRQQ